MRREIVGSGQASPKRQRKKAEASEPPPALDGSLAQHVDAHIAQQAVSKINQGILPSARETSALRSLEQRSKEQRQRELLRCVPQKLVRWMFGDMSTKMLQDWERNYGLPVAGKHTDLSLFGQRLREFLRDNARRLCGREGPPVLDDLLEGPQSPALERYRDERAKLARLERLRLEGELLPRQQVHEGLARLALILRGASEQLQRQFGSEAHALLEEAVNEFSVEVDGWLTPGKEAEHEKMETSASPMDARTRVVDHPSHSAGSADPPTRSPRRASRRVRRGDRGAATTD